MILTMFLSAALKNLRRMRDNDRSKGQKEKLQSLMRECQMISKQEGHTHIRERLKKGSGEAWKIVKELSGCDNKTTHQIKDGGETLNFLEASDKFNTFFVSKIGKI
jgi:hypothetical protein